MKQTTTTVNQEGQSIWPQPMTALQKLATQVQPKIHGDYESRNLSCCHFCGEKYNVGEKIPRILVHCGHTFCTECLSHLHHNFRVRCPACWKLIKNLESVERLPLNINILYEVVERDPVLTSLDFDDETPDGIESKLCKAHQDRIMHFYCSNHSTVFCRECIKEYHTEEECFVVDLYEIEKMRKLQTQNVHYNRGQLKKRKDRADQSCIIHEPIRPIVQKKSQPLDQERRGRLNEFLNGTTKPSSSIPQSQKILAMSKHAGPEVFSAVNFPGPLEDHMAYEYENEPTDEARTNEEAYEEMQQHFGGSKYDKNHMAGKLAAGNCIFFNEALDDDDQMNDDQSSDEEGEGQDEDDEDEEEEEDGEFDPRVIAGQSISAPLDDEDY